MPTLSDIIWARKRLGQEAFAELFERTCGQIAGETSVVLRDHDAGLLRDGVWSQTAILEGAHP